MPCFLVRAPPLSVQKCTWDLPDVMMLLLSPGLNSTASTASLVLWEANTYTHTHAHTHINYIHLKRFSSEILFCVYSCKVKDINMKIIFLNVLYSSSSSS